MKGMENPPHRANVQLMENRVVAEAVNLLCFTLVHPGKLDFAPGQYCTFLVEKGGPRVTRSYSFVSTPASGNWFELLVKRIDNGYVSNLLCDAKPGATFNVLLPLGKFRLREPVAPHALFLATGTGIAPFFPMLQELKERSVSTPTTLIAGYRHAEGSILPERFESLGKGWPNFHFLTVLSRPPEDWKGERGHIQDIVRRDFSDLASYDVYICGVPEMVNDAQNLVQELGAKKERVFVERY